jgi:hypothetical protein
MPGTQRGARDPLLLALQMIAAQVLGPSRDRPP